MLSNGSNFYEKKQGSSKFTGAVFLDSDIRKEGMSKKDHFNALFQFTSAENVKAIEFELGETLDESFSFLYIQLMTCFAKTIRSKCKLEVNQFSFRKLAMLYLIYNCN